MYNPFGAAPTGTGEAISSSYDGWLLANKSASQLIILSISFIQALQIQQVNQQTPGIEKQLGPNHTNNGFKLEKCIELFDGNFT